MNNFISLSGIDSSGKSTQIKRVIDYYNRQNIKTKVVWSRIGYTPIFELLKLFLRKVIPSKIPEPGYSNQRSEAFSRKWVQVIWLNIALLDMMILYCIYFRLKILFGFTIIADRYLWDSFIDIRMKFKRKDITKFILFKILVFCSPIPKRSIILTINSKESLKRSELKKEPFSENLSDRKLRINFYNDLIGRSKWSYVVNGHESVEQVWSKIKKIL